MDPTSISPALKLASRLKPCQVALRSNALTCRSPASLRKLARDMPRAQASRTAAGRSGLPSLGASVRSLS